MRAINVENLTKTYGEFTAVDKVNIHVDKGEIFGILGPNGAGKTTSIECMAGLKAFDFGQVKINEVDLKDYLDLYETIGVQLQETVYQNQIKVKEICELFSSFYDQPIDYMTLLERFDLETKLNLYVSKLSGGQRQKLSITLALIGDPEIVFLDELTTGLDPEARRDMWQYIKALKAEGRTVIMSTHYMEEAAILCDRICMIKAGKVIACDTVDQIIDDCKLPLTISFEMTSEYHLPGLIAVLGEADAELNGKRIKIKTREESILTDIIVHFHKQQCTFKNMAIDRATLDDVYLHMIGGHYEDTNDDH